jgi:threonine dehydratase
VRAAAERLRGVVRQTPLECSAALSQAAGAEVHLKLEGMQRTGSFKLRGAYNFMASLSPAEQARGVVTASAGNHGQGVALAAGLLGCRARVYVPASAPECKQRRISRLGAELVRVEGGYDQAHAAAEQWAAQSGACFVHAFSDPRVVAGQGTVGLELFEQLPGLRTILVPVGGGGLAGGVGVVARALGPTVRVVGVQTVETAAMHDSLAAGHLVSPAYGDTLCEGLSGDIDERALGLAQSVLDQVVLVEEAAVRDAIRWLYLEEGLVAEGSAAVVVAALLHAAAGPLYGPVVAVLSGSNLDASRLASILAEA